MTAEITAEDREKLVRVVTQWISEDPDEKDAGRSCRAARRRRRGPSSPIASPGPLEFGTAGLRGVVGAGQNRMNRAVVIRTTAGLAHYLELDVARRADARRRARLRRAPREPRVRSRTRPRCSPPRASRRTSSTRDSLRADAARRVRGARPRRRGRRDGHREPQPARVQRLQGLLRRTRAQIVPPTDEGIADAIDARSPRASVPRMDEAEARAKGSSQHRRVARRRATSTRSRRALADGATAAPTSRIVYTPMHGVGDAFAHEAFARLGFARVVSVPEQAEPDGAFPTVRVPEPRGDGRDGPRARPRRARRSADLVIANDPDADRLAVAVPRRPTASTCSSPATRSACCSATTSSPSDPAPDEGRARVTTIVSSPHARRDRARARRSLRRDAHRLQVDREPRDGDRARDRRALRLRLRRGARLHGRRRSCATRTASAPRLVFAELAASLKARGETRARPPREHLPRATASS